MIRWREAVWERRGLKAAWPEKIGELVVIAEMLREHKQGSWIWLLVRGCEVMSDRTSGRRVHPLKAEKQIKRKRETIDHGRPQRTRVGR